MSDEKSADTIAAEAGLIDDPQSDARCDLYGYPIVKVPVSPAGYAAGGGDQERYDAAVQHLQASLTERWRRVFALEDENAILRAKLSAANEIIKAMADAAIQSHAVAAETKPALAHNPFRSFRAPGLMGMARS